MKRPLLLLILLGTLLPLHAQSESQARKVLDQAAAVFKKSGGLTLDFTLERRQGSHSGTLHLQGNKYHMTTDQLTVWFDGQTQWSYLPSSGEVNITTPVQNEQYSVNPYALLNIYKSGYSMTLKSTREGSQDAHEVHLRAQKGQRLKEIILLVDKKTSHLLRVRMLQGTQWATISIHNLRKQKHPDTTFRFNPKDYPKAEVIDLR